MKQLNMDDGFYYGIGVFETIAVEEGKPVWLNEHLRRMEQGIHFLKLQIPIEKVKEGAEEFLKKPEYQNGRTVLKITVSEKNLRFDYRKNQYGKERYEKGFSVGLCKGRRNETSALTYYKTINYAENFLEKRKIAEAGFDEGVFLNTKDAIAEGTSTNIFFVKKGRIETPPVNAGVLRGITRQYICENYDVIERNIRLKDLGQYDEIFLTNALLGIMPVVAFEDLRFEKGKMTEFLQKEYKTKMC